MGKQNFQIMHPRKSLALKALKHMHCAVILTVPCSLHVSLKWLRRQNARANTGFALRSSSRGKSDRISVFFGRRQSGDRLTSRSHISRLAGQISMASSGQRKDLKLSKC